MQFIQMCVCVYILQLMLALTDISRVPCLLLHVTTSVNPRFYITSTFMSTVGSGLFCSHQESNDSSRTCSVCHARSSYPASSSHRPHVSVHVWNWFLFWRFFSRSSLHFDILFVLNLIPAKIPVHSAEGETTYSFKNNNFPGASLTEAFCQVLFHPSKIFLSAIINRMRI